MTNSNHKKKSGRPPAAASAPSAPSPKTLRIVKENGRLIGLTVLGTVLSVAIAFPPLSPLIVTAPVIQPLRRRVRAGERAAVSAAFWRWALTVFLTVLVSTAFVRDRVFSSFPFASQAAVAMEQAIAGAGSAPVGITHIVVGMVAFLGLATASLGIAACVLMAVALGTAAAAAAVLFTHGNNVLLISLVACPPWLWAAFAAATIGFAPAVAAGGIKWFRVGADMVDYEWLKRRAVIAGGLFLLAVLLRLIAAGPYLSLIRLWTVV
jgi:hypothetical protein